MNTAILRSACGAVLGLSLLTGCDLEFPEQEVYVRHNAGTDSADVLLIYKGLGYGKSLEDGLKAIERLQGGARELMVVDWPFYWNVEDMVAEARKRLAAGPGNLDPEEWEEARRQAERELAIAEQVSLASYGLFLDPEGRFSGYHLVHFRNLGWLMQTVNDLISGEIRKSEARRHEQEDADEDDVTSRTRDLWIEKAERGTPWVFFQNRALVIEVPLSAEDARRVLSNSVQWIASADESDLKGIDLLAELLTTLESYEYRGEVLRFVLRDPVQPGLALALQFHVPGREYDPRLYEELESRGGAELPLDRNLEQVRNLLRTF